MTASKFGRVINQLYRTNLAIKALTSPIKRCRSRWNALKTQIRRIATSLRLKNDSYHLVDLDESSSTHTFISCANDIYHTLKRVKVCWSTLILGSLVRV